MIKLLALDYDWTMLDYSAHKPAFSQDLLDYLTRFIAAGGDRWHCIWPHRGILAA